MSRVRDYLKIYDESWFRVAVVVILWSVTTLLLVCYWRCCCIATLHHYISCPAREERAPLPSLFVGRSGRVMLAGCLPAWPGQCLYLVCVQHQSAVLDYHGPSRQSGGGTRYTWITPCHSDNTTATGYKGWETFTHNSLGLSGPWHHNIIISDSYLLLSIDHLKGTFHGIHSMVYICWS